MNNTPRPRPPGAAAADAGTVSVMLAALFTGALLLAGILADAGRVLDANAEAADLAGKAARAGAQQLSTASIRAGSPALDPAAATATAEDYLTRHGAAGQANATASTVTVTAHLHVDYTLLALSGHGGRTVTQTRTAAATRGP